MSVETIIYRQIMTLLFIFICLFMIIKHFYDMWFYLGFIILGIPIIIFVTAFWYEMFKRFFNL